MRALVYNGPKNVAIMDVPDAVIDATERRIWFLYEYLKDTDRFD